MAVTLGVEAVSRQKPPRGRPKGGYPEKKFHFSEFKPDLDPLSPVDKYPRTTYEYGNHVHTSA
jgi:hypothetical protein